MRVSKEDFEATKFLGGVVGAKYPFLKKIAMLNPEERELIGLSQCMKILIKNEQLLTKEYKEVTPKDFETILSKIFEPILTALGESKYKMSEISHLACKIGSTKKRYKEAYPTF